MGDVGHNSIAADELRSFCERVERLQGDIDEAKADQKEVFAEAKARGYDMKALRGVLKLRKADKDKLAEEQAMLELYADALGIDVFK